MLLFDIIRDWFVMYIWGGVASNEATYFTHFGYVFSEDGAIDGEALSSEFMLPIGKSLDYVIGDSHAYDTYMAVGDWLSTTSTIIVMTLLCVVFGLMVRWLFRLTAGLLRGN